MIGAVERNEALGVLRRLEYLAGVVDADYRVQRCVKDQEGLPQRADPLGRALLFQILQKLLSHRERAPGERHLGLAFGFDFLPRLFEQVTDVGGIERGADGRNGLRLRHVLRGREHGSTAERMADQQLRGLILFAQVISRSDYVA
jgi:hypothetical protein